MNQSTVGNRLKTIRTEFKLTQQSFADRIGISRGALANYEVDRNEPIDAVISLICREFGINEEWLRNGTGRMKRNASREEEVEALVNSALKGNNEFKKAVIQAICSRTDKELEALDALLSDIYANLEKASDRKTRVIKIAGRDGSMEELALTDEDANEYLNRIDQLPDAGDDL